MKTLTASLLCTASCLMCSAAFALDPDDERDAPAVEISAFRIPVLESEAVQGVTVINGQQIRERNATSVAEILQWVPGVHVDRQGGAGGFTSVYIRGADLEHTLVLIDGIRMNDPLLERPGYDFSALDPNAIERVEVIRGAGSAIYGSDAIGGVINIVTRRDVKEPMRLSATAGLGTLGYANGSARIAGSGERVRYSGGVAKLQDGKESDGGEIDLTTFDGALSWRPVSSTQVNLTARHSTREGSAFPETSGGIRLATLRTLERREADENVLAGGVTFSPTEDWSISAQLSRYAREQDIDSPGVASVRPAFQSTTELTRNVALVSASLKLPMGTELTIGHERQSEDGDTFASGALSYSLKRNTNAIFAAIKSKPTEALVVLADVRYDRVSGLESELSPGVGIRYQLARSGTALKLRYSEGFRPPSFYALSDPFVGNRNLVVETSRSYEVGAEQSVGDNNHLGLAFFKTRTRNLIDFDGNVFSMVNRDTVDTKGVELYASAQPMEGLDVGLQYTYVTSDVKNSTDELKNRPRHRASVALNYRIDESSRLAINIARVGRSFDQSFASTSQTTVASYVRADVGYTYSWQKFSVSAAIDNLFDKHYEEFIGFTAPGRRYRLSISATF